MEYRRRKIWLPQNEDGLVAHTKKKKKKKRKKTHWRNVKPLDAVTPLIVIKNPQDDEGKSVTLSDYYV